MEHYVKSDQPIDATPRGQFIRVPSWWISSGTLARAASECGPAPLALITLIGHVNQYEGVAWPSDEYLGRECSCSETSVKTALRLAQSLGMIERRTRKYRRRDGRMADGRAYAIVTDGGRHGDPRHDAPRRGDDQPKATGGFRQLLGDEFCASVRAANTLTPLPPAAPTEGQKDCK